MIRLEKRTDGIVLPIRAQPGSRKRAIVGEFNGALKVAVNQPPERGKANQAIIAVLSEELELRQSQVQLIQGAASSQKKFLITGISIAELQSRIDRITRTSGNKP